MKHTSDGCSQEVQTYPVEPAPNLKRCRAVGKHSMTPWTHTYTQTLTYTHTHTQAHLQGSRKGQDEQALTQRKAQNMFKKKARPHKQVRAGSTDLSTLVWKSHCQDMCVC